MSEDAPDPGAPTAPSSASIRGRRPALTRAHGRFRLGPVLGRGGVGIVTRALDLDLDRSVAVKSLRAGDAATEAEVLHFLAEARLHGRLEHPNIAPVYELGSTEDGRPYFAMRRLGGRTLQTIISGLRKKDSRLIRDFGRARLLTVFLQLCGAVGYAHAQGVVHKDLKPANVVVGDFGDVQLIDWGLAERHADIDVASPAGPVRGTPGYIAPEMLWERDHVVPRLGDIWSLGVVLYQLLTYERPFPGTDPDVVLEATMAGAFERPTVRARPRTVPGELEEICLGAMAYDPVDRPQTVEDLARQVEAFLEGDREATRRRREAGAAYGQAEASRARLLAVAGEVEEAERAAGALRAQVKPWDRIETKRLMWAAEDRARDLHDAWDDLFTEAERDYRRAMELVAGHAPSRVGLNRLWWERFRRDEAAGNRRGARRAAARIRQLDPEGAEEALRGGGHVSVTSDPEGASVWLHTFELKDRLAVPAAGVPLGHTPLTDLPLPRGHHLLMIERTGRAPLRLPLVIGRESTRRVHARLLDLDVVPQGMVHVPGGPFIAGGAPTPYGVPSATHRAELPDVAIGAFPVTFGEYAHFLATLDASICDERTPRALDGTPLLVRDGDRFVPQLGVLVGPEATLSPRRARRFPVVGVTWDDARAWCAWTAERTGRAIRLPGTLEWEKAARGVDGRRYPWGDTWDPGFVNRAGSRPGPPRLEAVGVYGMDTSIYGVRDACGGVREWCAEATADGERACRGGDWTRTDDQPLAAPSSAPPSTRSLRIGFRPCLSLDA